jgi:1-acyl-sn-glycerol-3-phosphate acyltransferase
LLATFGANGYKMRLHGSHKDFSYLEYQQGKSRVNTRKYVQEADQTIIISNEACLIDWIYMSLFFAPIYVSIDLINDEQMGLRPFSRWELVKRAIGIKLPRQRDGLVTSFRALRETHMSYNRPIVVFPQCTRTNGRGVLDFPPSVVEMLYKACKEDNFKLHAIRFDYSFTHFSPYNTVDVSGWKHMLGLLM